MSGYQPASIPPAAQQQMMQVAQSFPGTVVKGPGYEVPLQLPAGVITLSISFPGNYPNQPPVMYVLNAITHRLVSDNLQILYPPPKDWNPAYSIFTIVRYIHNVFKQEPPAVRMQPPAQPVSMPPQTTPQSSSQPIPQSSSQPQARPTIPTQSRPIRQIDPSQKLAMYP